MKKIIEAFVRQSLFGNLLTVFVVLVGIAALFLIRREVFPNVTYDIITITTVFPGASPQEVEQLITNPIEQDLKEIDGVKRLESHSVESQSVIVLRLDPDQTTEEKAKSDVRDIVDRFKAQLPEGAEEPLVSALESKQQPIIEVSVAGDMPELELREQAKRIQDELEDIPGVARVNPVGLQDLEIRVETDLTKLRRYQLSLENVVNALRTTNVSIPGGTIEVPAGAKESERTVRTSGRFKNPEDVKNTVIRANDLGRAILVKDVAEVRYQLEKPTVLDHTDGKPSIRLTVLKKEKFDAIKVVDQVHAKMDEIADTLDKRIKVAYINDLSYLIKRRLILTSNLGVGLFLVLILLSFLLPHRTALIVSLGIPFSFFGTMILFNAYDYSINLISMIGLIIVSGMLIDDAIVVTDNCARYMEEGYSPAEAAIKGTHEVWIPVTASVMTTVVVFLPMFYMSGIFGKFVKQIPLGVVIALCISLLEAFIILPGHLAHWSKPNTRKPGDEAPKPKKGRLARIWDEVVEPTYERIVRFNIRHRYLVAVTTFLFVVGSFVIAGTAMRFVLFPADDIEIFMIRAQAPTGTSLQQTEALIKPVEDIVSALPEKDLKNFLTTVGMYWQGPETNRRGSEYAQLTVFLTPPQSRERNDKEIIEELREKIGTPPGFLRVSFERVQGGPPVGRPIDLGIRAKEYEQIVPAMKHIKDMLGGLDGVTDIQDSYIMGKEEVNIKVEPNEAAAANISVRDIGNTVRASFEGLIATSIPGLDEEIDVRVVLPKAYRTDGTTLEKLRIPNLAQNLVPLSQVSTHSTSQGLAEYEHEAFERQIEVTAAVDTEKTSATEVNNLIRAKVPEIEKMFPGVTVAFGGEDQDTAESMASLGRAFIVALLGIFLILVLTFRNLLHPFLVFLMIPLGLAAVIWAFILHGKPLTFMGMLGMIALAGVIVNNAIVLIDFVNQRRQNGADGEESIISAAKSRLRPIFLTTATTVVGLMPTTYGIGGLDPFVVYITMALAWGMVIGSTLIVLVLPSAIAIMDDIANRFDRLLGRKPATA